MLIQAVDKADVISLAPGLVDYDTLPTDESGQLLREMFAEAKAAQAALQYGTTAGLAELRQLLLEHMAALDGVPVEHLGATPDQVVITTGSQQMLSLLSEVLLDVDDIVITAWPSYFVYTGTLQAFGVEVRGVDIDSDGIVPEALDALLGRLEKEGKLSRVKIVYAQGYHQNPTGITLAGDRKGTILDIVRRYSRGHRILLIEDAAYRELTYEGTPPVSFKRYDEGNRFVALAQTFSKPFAPGVKTGYALLPAELVEPVVLQKGNVDFGSNNLCQHLLLAAMQKGVYARHLQTLRRCYAAKCHAMLEALQEHLGDFDGGAITWTKPSGGLYIYVTMPECFDTGPDGLLFARALEEGTTYVPGEYCFGPDPTRRPPRNTLRLCFGQVNIDQVRIGVERLAKAIKAVAPQMLARKQQAAAK